MVILDILNFVYSSIWHICCCVVGMFCKLCVIYTIFFLQHTHTRTHTRCTVKYLLNHEFFAEGVKFEVIPQPEDTTQFKMRMEVPGRENKKNGQESIEFAYNLETDVPEEVVGEMVSPSVCLSVRLSLYVCLSVCPPVCLSVCLSEMR